MLSSRSESATSLAHTAFRDHAGELQRFLVRRVARVEDADDLAQEVFARLLRIRNADLVRNPLSYLLGIATHVVREFRQRKQHERVLFDSDLAEGLSAYAEDDAATGMAEQLELRERLDKALKRLPTAHQLVLLLVKRDGLSYTEAASAAGLSVHTIEKYVVEARARLRVMLTEAPQ
jgi:RNA polymerase sigma factor (sigma-70 family)